MTPTIRPARPDDAAAVAAFTADTWPERDGDYVPHVFESWVRENEAVRDDGPEAHTLVAADEDDAPIGLLRTVLVNRDEAWCGGMRVDPAHRGEGVAVDLVHAGFDWARERGGQVARAMVFGWNAAGLGVARAAGFEPVTEFRWAPPEPADGGPTEAVADPDPDAVWDYWSASDARAHLRGLALAPAESWALSTLTRERLATAADAATAGADPGDRTGGQRRGARPRRGRRRTGLRARCGPDGGRGCAW